MTLDTARGIVLGTRYSPTPGLFERVRKYFSRAASQQYLGLLDDRSLRELGIHRAQIELREFLN
jgi:uncharacterized protein YjiS (DUF1127 family)